MWYAGFGREGARVMGKRWFWVFVLPGFAGVLGLILLPFADVVRRSFTTAVTGEFVGLSNYKSIFGNEAFLLAVKNTARFVAFCLPVLLLAGFLAALLLSGLSSVQLWKSVFLFPMAVPAATVVLVWRLVFDQKGFLNALTGWDIDYMETGFSFWVLVFSYVWRNLGYTVVLWLSGILAVPADMVEAAKVDGAGRLRIVGAILLPQLKGVFYTITVLSFLNSFKAFREAYLVAGEYPQEDMYLLQHLFNNWFVWMDLDKMAAAAVCLAGVLLVLIGILTALWEEGTG